MKPPAAASVGDNPSASLSSCSPRPKHPPAAQVVPHPSESLPRADGGIQPLQGLLLLCREGVFRAGGGWASGARAYNAKSASDGGEEGKSGRTKRGHAVLLWTENTKDDNKINVGKTVSTTTILSNDSNNSNNSSDDHNDTRCYQSAEQPERWEHAIQDHETDLLERERRVRALLGEQRRGREAPHPTGSCSPRSEHVAHGSHGTLMRLPRAISNTRTDTTRRQGISIAFQAFGSSRPLLDSKCRTDRSTFIRRTAP